MFESNLTFDNHLYSWFESGLEKMMIENNLQRLQKQLDVI